MVRPRPFRLKKPRTPITIVKSSIPILTCLAILTGWAVAQVPKKVPNSRYSPLWTNSPFTSKPPPVEPGVEADIVADYALVGVSPVSGGYRVTILNKKKPEERITLDPDNIKSTFKVVRVTPMAKRSR